ncbi:Dabb family protein [Nonomuraea sp. NPDC048916]|uniref:Dabb family protein n=1 Tax=Nonomuraea sp. NPDC048916 TaxID=3154232 RepID=UPI0033E834F2
MRTAADDIRWKFPNWSPLLVITHVVLFKFRAEHAGEIATSQRMLGSLHGQVPQIRSLSVGSNILPSERAYDLCLIATFDSLEDLARYRAHPEHQSVATQVDRYCQSTVSVDY